MKKSNGLAELNDQFGKELSKRANARNLNTLARVITQLCTVFIAALLITGALIVALVSEPTFAHKSYMHLMWVLLAILGITGMAAYEARRMTANTASECDKRMRKLVDRMRDYNDMWTSDSRKGLQKLTELWEDDYSPR